MKKKRKFLCEGCRGNQTGDLRKSAGQLVQCEFANGSVEPVPFESGLYYEHCKHRQSRDAQVLIPLARAARAEGTCCPKRLEPVEQKIRDGLK